MVFFVTILKRWVVGIPDPEITGIYPAPVLCISLGVTVA